MKFEIRTEDDRQRAIACLNKLDLKKPVVFEVRPVVKHRSKNQSSLYWVWLHAIADQTGNSAEDLHEYFKEKYLPKIFVETTLGGIHKVRSTTELTTEEFNEYLGKIYLEVTSGGYAEVYYPEDALYPSFYEHYSRR